MNTNNYNLDELLEDVYQEFNYISECIPDKMKLKDRDYLEDKIRETRGKMQGIVMTLIAVINSNKTRY